MNGHSGASPASGSQHGGPLPALCLASLACTLKVLVQNSQGEEGSLCLVSILLLPHPHPSNDGKNESNLQAVKRIKWYKAHNRYSTHFK